ncbi:hypothetical protein GQR58_022225 [Nymphon striatum]|nr:hypothetical protein GQR58_022225 [Nymphon striatum]
MSLRIKLRERTPTCTEVTKQSTTKAQCWRSNLISDKPRFIQFKEDDAIRSKVYRANISHEKRLKAKELSKLRMREYRKRQKENKVDNNNNLKVSKRLTRADEDRKKIQREKWKVKKQEQRKNMSFQKQTQLNKKRRKLYNEKKVQQEASHSTVQGLQRCRSPQLHRSHQSLTTDLQQPGAQPSTAQRGQINLRQCLCEYCINVEYLLRTLNQAAINAGRPQDRIKDVYELASCTAREKLDGAKYHRDSCVRRECCNCGVHMIRTKLEVLLQVIGTKEFAWHKYESEKQIWSNKSGDGVSTATKKVLSDKNGTLDDLVVQLMELADPFTLHLHNAAWQSRQFQRLRNDVPAGWVIMVLDFAENYACNLQDEAQSCHWNHGQCTVHPIVTYYNCNICSNGIVTESLVCVSDDRKHDHHAVRKFVEVANTHLQDTRGLSINHEVQFTDGCSSQYKLKEPFYDISRSLEDNGFTLERCYYGLRHGKGASDGESAVVKSKALAADSLTKDNDPDKCVHHRRTCFWIPSTNISRDRDQNAMKTLPGTRSVHASVQTTTTDPPKEGSVVPLQQPSHFTIEPEMNGAGHGDNDVGTEVKETGKFQINTSIYPCLMLRLLMNWMSLVSDIISSMSHTPDTELEGVELLHPPEVFTMRSHEDTTSGESCKPVLARRNVIVCASLPRPRTGFFFPGCWESLQHWKIGSGFQYIDKSDRRCTTERIERIFHIQNCGVPVTSTTTPNISRNQVIPFCCDDSQYEMKRADDLKKLNSNAVPTIFAHNKQQTVCRKSSRIRGPSLSTQCDAAPVKSLKLDHSYFKHHGDISHGKFAAGKCVLLDSTDDCVEIGSEEEVMQQSTSTLPVLDTSAISDGHEMQILQANATLAKLTIKFQIYCCLKMVTCQKTSVFEDTDDYRYSMWRCGYQFRDGDKVCFYHEKVYPTSYESLQKHCAEPFAYDQNLLMQLQYDELSRVKPQGLPNVCVRDATRKGQFHGKIKLEANRKCQEALRSPGIGGISYVVENETMIMKPFGPKPLYTYASRYPLMCTEEARKKTFGNAGSELSVQAHYFNMVGMVKQMVCMMLDEDFNMIKILMLENVDYAMDEAIFSHVKTPSGYTTSTLQLVLEKKRGIADTRIKQNSTKKPDGFAIGHQCDVSPLHAWTKIITLQYSYFYYFEFVLFNYTCRTIVCQEISSPVQSTFAIFETLLFHIRTKKLFLVRDCDLKPDNPCIHPRSVRATDPKHRRHRTEVVKIRDKSIDLKETKDLYGRLMVLARSSSDVDQKEAIGNFEFTLTPRALFAPKDCSNRWHGPRPKVEQEIADDGDREGPQRDVLRETDESDAKI